MLIRRAFLLAALMFSTLKAFSQTPMPDRVIAGAMRTYWVDSTEAIGSTFTWSVDGTILQNGARCAFVHRWNREGTFELSVGKLSPIGCQGEISTGLVTVASASTDQPSFEIRIFPNPADGPEIKFQLASAVNTRITIDLFQSNGQLVSRLYDGQLSVGITETIVFSHQLSQGIYPYQIRTDHQVINGRLIVMRIY